MSIVIENMVSMMYYLSEVRYSDLVYRGEAPKLINSV
jgi:hypothetical protein